MPPEDPNLVSANAFLSQSELIPYLPDFVSQPDVNAEPVKDSTVGSANTATVLDVEGPVSLDAVMDDSASGTAPNPTATHETVVLTATAQPNDVSH